MQRPDRNDTRATQSRMFRALMRQFSAPRLNMREDYEKVRRVQRHLAKLRTTEHDALDRSIASANGDHEIPLRIFVPKEQTRDAVLLFLHGGGWVTGDVESYSPACRTMADLTGCVVASVDYRLAPEHPFPAGLEDCRHVADRVLAEPSLIGAASPDDIVLVGDSAGGNLAAVVSQLRREQGAPGVSDQILLYPVTHWNHDPATSPFESVRLHGDDYRLTNTEVQDYFDLYVPDAEQRRSPLVAPLMAQQSDGMPRTLLITAGLDLLRDEGEAYARALEAAGNEVRTYRVEGALHGFITLPRFSRALREAYEVINEFLDTRSAR